MEKVKLTKEQVANIEFALNTMEISYEQLPMALINQAMSNIDFAFRDLKKGEDLPYVERKRKKAIQEEAHSKYNKIIQRWIKTYLQPK